MTLDKASRGQLVQIIKINDETIRVQAIRLGIFEGSYLTCAEKIPLGPIILSDNKQEVAIGRGLASQILVEMVI